MKINEKSLYRMKRNGEGKLKKGMIVRVRSVRDKSYKYPIIVEPIELPIPEGCQPDDLEPLAKLTPKQKLELQ